MKRKPYQVSRRSFVRTCSAAAALTGLPLWFCEWELEAADRKPKPLSANDRPGIGLVGCGGMGRSDAKNATRFGNILAVCDVDQKHLRRAREQFTQDGKTPDGYADFRKLMERDDIHVIVNGTPDHWHTLVNLAACRAHKDIYSEKPLTLTIDEGRHVIAAVHKSGTVLQTGTQQRSDSRFRLACELVRNGRIGTLKEVVVWLPAGLHDGPFQAAVVPPELNWDSWLGQSPKVPYVPQRCHTNFRFWYDYSGGSMTDWGAHHNDIALWAIGLPGPTHIDSRVLTPPIPGGYTTFSEYEVTFTYASGVVHRVRTTKADNIFGAVVDREGQRNGVRFEGTDGWIWVNRTTLQTSDKARIEAPLPDTALRLYKSDDHMGNLFDCVRSRKAPICDVETGHRSASICHLGAISLRLSQALQWDPVRGQFVGDHAAQANALVSRRMRKPYNYDFVA